MQNVKPSRFFSAFVTATGYLPAWIFLKPKVYCHKNAKRKLPKTCILMSNHTSLLDFMLYLVVFAFGNIRFLMAEVLFEKGKLFSWFLYKLGGIFVDRDAFDFSFVGDSLTALESGQRVGIFPQSRLPVKGTKFPFKPSVILIALRTDAPIIPVYTNGDYHIFHRAKVMIGEPIYLREQCAQENPDGETLERLRVYLENAVDELQMALEKREADEKR